VPIELSGITVTDKVEIGGQKQPSLPPPLLPPSSLPPTPPPSPPPPLFNAVYTAAAVAVAISTAYLGASFAQTPLASLITIGMLKRIKKYINGTDSPESSPSATGRCPGLRSTSEVGGVRLPMGPAFGPIVYELSST